MTGEPREENGLKSMFAFAMVLFLAVVSVSVRAADYSIALKSNYVGSISGSILHDGPVLQGSATFPLKSAYVGIWFSMAGGDEDDADEIDLYFGKSFGTINCGAYYYALKPVAAADGDYIAPYIDWTPKVRGAIKPFLHVEDDFSTKGLSSGCLYGFGAKGTIGKVGLKLSMGGHLKAFGVSAEPIEFMAITGSMPVRGVDLSLKLQKKCGRSDGFAKDATTISVSKSFN